jgi:4-amino-4-deoxy-L-arabinose transferase-like glycosyltransferase
MIKNSSYLTRTLLITLALLVLVRLLTLGYYPLYDTTEARYAEIARKMVELNDWVTPWFDYGVPFWGKPPLSFWLSAASIKLFGVNEFAARLPHFLCGLLVAWLVWDWAARNSRREAIYATVLLLGSTLFFISTGAVMTDMELTLGCFLIIRGFWLGLNGTAEEQRRERWVFFIGMGIGLLAKGPIALVLSGLPIVIWVFAKSNLMTVWRGLPWLRGLLLTLLIAAPWYVIAETHTPGFLNYFIIGEHWHRFVTPGWHGDQYGHAHLFPHGSIWVFTFGALLPWSILLPIAALWWRKSGNSLPNTVDAHQRSWRLYLLLCGLMPCVFFTGAANIIWTYGLPGIPALALWGAYWLNKYSKPAQVEKLLIAGLVLTLVGWAGYLVKIEYRGMNEMKVAKAVVLDYQALNNSGERLIFLHKRPYSAEFYSQGKAELAPNVTALLEKIEQKPAYVAISSDSEIKLPAELMQKLQLVKRQGDFDLYHANPADRH